MQSTDEEKYLQSTYIINIRSATHRWFMPAILVGRLTSGGLQLEANPGK
jgi:hypothetical protein